MPGEAPAGEAPETPETAERKRLRFSRKQRLQKSWEFERVRLEGQRLVKGCLILNWRAADGANHASRLGVVTSRKIGNAVVRSRARRLLREVFRTHQHDFVRPLEMVLIARQSIGQKSYAEVEKDFVAAARPAGIMRKVR